jgi:hypothetical protein
MRTAGLWAVFIAACAGEVPRPTAGPSAAAHVVEVATPYVPTPAIAVNANELGDPGVMDRLAYRTRVTTWGALWLREDARGPAPKRMAYTGEASKDVSVLDVAHDRVRIVIEDDDTRYGVWIARTDTATVPLVTIQLADRDGRAIEGNGVWLSPGAPIELGARIGRRREVIARDEALRVRGFVPASALGDVWRVAETNSAAAAKAASASEHVWIDAEVPIRAAPDAAASAVAMTSAQVEAVKLAARETYGGWQWIEIERPFERVRGYVPGGVMRTESTEFGTIGTGGGHGFGISDTDPVTLAVGTCLFDAVNGEIVGVNLGSKQRVGAKPEADHPGWWMVYVDSPWSALELWAHDASPDPQRPSWETCGSFAH